MLPSALELLACPDCGGDLRLGSDDQDLLCPTQNRRFPIVNGIPRLVPRENYGESFGLQWTLHARTQIDKFNGTHISRDRLQALTGWSLPPLRGLRVLEVGSGSGRFTQIFHDAGAEVFTVDLSNAIDVNRANNGTDERLLYFQASIYELPFKPETFDRVACINVLQHTPDARAAFTALTRLVKPGGQLASNIYKRTFKSTLNWKYLLRPLTRRMPHELLYRMIARSAPALLRISNLCARRGLHPIARRIIPIHDYSGQLPLTSRELCDWAILDTFDSLSPRYDHPQPPGTLVDWCRAAGLEVLRSTDEGCTITGLKP